MSQSDSISSLIRSFIAKTFPAARKRGISDEAQLLGSGVIDSLGVLTVVGFLEQSFTITVSDDELTPDNFSSIKSLVSFVEKKKGKVGILVE